MAVAIVVGRAGSVGRVGGTDSAKPLNWLALALVDIGLSPTHAICRHGSEDSMSEFQPRRCVECGEGTVRPLAKAGRRMPFRNMAAVTVPADFQIPTCDRCGAERIDGPTSKALDVVLDDAYSRELSDRLVRSLERVLSYGITQRRLEQLLGLSQGYLSRLKAERGEGSPQIVAALALLAEDRRRLDELNRLWGPEYGL